MVTVILKNILIIVIVINDYRHILNIKFITFQSDLNRLIFLNYDKFQIKYLYKYLYVQINIKVPKVFDEKKYFIFNILIISEINKLT